MRSLLDTNLLVYADSGDAPAKQRTAIAVIKAHRAAGTAVVSTQVLQEFASVALRKLRMPAALVRERLEFYRRCEVVPTTPELILDALNLHAVHGLAYYDALIVQAAIASGCRQVLSEDLQTGATLGGVVIVNPFKPA